MLSFNVVLNGRVKEARPFVESPDWPDFGERQASESDDLRGTPDLAEEERGEQEVSTHAAFDEDFLAERIEAEKEAAFRQGYEMGKREGLEQGRKMAEKEIQPQLELLKNLVAALREEKESFYQENEVYIVKLAIEIARKILHRELTQNPDLLLYIVREALRKVAGTGRIIIHVHPDDYQILKDKRSQLGASLSAFEQVDFVPSDEVQRGGCVIESDSGIVDAQLDVQLDQIERSLLEGSDV